MISVITPSVRKGGLDIVRKCLNWQTYKDYEWIVVSPYEYKDADVWIPDPPKGSYDMYVLNKAWNQAFKQAKGELVVSIVDLLWFPSDILENLWIHYKFDPRSCIGGVGHQYSTLHQGKPEDLVWRDPRIRTDSQYYPVMPMDFELCVASLPLAGIKEVGGMDEEFDKYAALSEKDMCTRMGQVGYKFYIDQTIEYRAVKHPRLTEDWDERYKRGCEYFNWCMKEVSEGNRIRLDYLT